MGQRPEGTGDGPLGGGAAMAGGRAWVASQDRGEAMVSATPIHVC